MELCPIKKKKKKKKTKTKKKKQQKTKTKHVIYPTCIRTIRKRKLQSDKENADVLADLFTLVFTKDSDGDMPDIAPKDVPELNNIEINPSIVKKPLDRLKVNKSPGPDLLQPRLLKELSEVLSYPLPLVFRKSIDLGKLPHEWTCTNITVSSRKEIRNMLVIIIQ